MAANPEAATYPVTWKNGRIASWLVTVDHKRIGILYVLTSLFFFVLGGILAILMRSQLATPGEKLLTKNAYNSGMDKGKMSLAGVVRAYEMYKFKDLSIVAGKLKFTVKETLFNQAASGSGSGLGGS